MSRREINTIQAIELRNLLEEIGDDPILAPQFRERLAKIEEELRNSPEEPADLLPQIPRTAMFLRGGGVLGSKGIRADLAGEVLTQFGKMFTEQTIHNEREAARDAGRARRPKGSPTPKLLFTGTPRGSFGLEFVPQPPDNPALREGYSQAIVTVTETLLRVASGDPAAIDEVIGTVPDAVLGPMRQFLKTLADHEAELRVAFQGKPSASLSAEQIARAADQLNKEVKYDQIIVTGLFQGVTLQTGVFDLLTDDGDLITGSVGGELVEDLYRHAHPLTERRCEALLIRQTIRRATGAARVTYLLLGLKEILPQPPAPPPH